MSWSPPSTAIPNQTPNLGPELMQRAAWRAAVLGSLSFAALVLSARLIVLVAVGGGIALTWLCLQQPDPYRLGALGIYCVAMVLTGWLASRKP